MGRSQVCSRVWSFRLSSAVSKWFCHIGLAGIPPFDKLRTNDHSYQSQTEPVLVFSQAAAGKPEKHILEVAGPAGDLVAVERQIVQ